MDNITPYLGFAMVSLLIALSPGPSWAYTISTTLGHGRKLGMIGNLGNSTGILCHAIAVACGLAALLEMSSTAFHVIKYLGAGYLVYLALRNFRGAPAVNNKTGLRKTSTWKIFRNGALVSIFNPKISLLMLALLPQFVDPAASNPAVQIGIMGGMHALIAGVVHTNLVFFSACFSRKLKQPDLMQKAMRWATGAVFLGFGIRLALTEQ
jgi:threonine/homoserine/homoserine lactone efflux protein